MEQGHIKLVLRSGSQRTPAGKWYNAALLVISCRPISKLSCHVSPQQLWYSHEPRKHTHTGPLPFKCRQKNTHTPPFFFFYLTGKNIQSICVRLNPNTHWLVQNWLWCVPLLVWLYYVCVSVCFEHWVTGPGAWNRWSARCLKDGGGGFRVVAVRDSTGPCWLLLCLRTIN